MAKRNNRIDTEVIALAVTGLSQRAIAQKLSLSQATVSKILSEEKNNQKLSNGEEVITDYVLTERQNNRTTAHNVIDKIINGLEKDLENASIKDKRELLKTLVELYGLPEEKEEAVTKIEIEIEDASGGTED
jgi:predicted transcriptional regulator